jgi:hypothetical protein
MFASCSDDETVKIWGVSEKIKIEVSNSPNFVKYDVKNEEIDPLTEQALSQNNRRSR